jgi:protein-S-isoprenylcysteine O-methyltransferase Ste14
VSSWQTASIVVLGTAAYLGLAVLGWGSLTGFLAHPARVALVLVTLVLVLLAAFSRGHLRGGEREDRSNRWVLAAFGAIGLLLGYLPAFMDRRGLWVLDGDAVRWAGVALYALGGGLRIWPVFVLGERFSGLVAIQPGHALVTTGLYGRIRHPSYLGMLLGSLGWALTFRSAAGVVLTACMVPIVLARIRAEEALLAAHFGADYAEYRRRTWRLLPGVY